MDETHGIHADQFLFAIAGVSGGVMVDKLEGPALDDIDACLGAVGQGLVNLFSLLTIRDVLVGDNNLFIREGLADSGGVDHTDEGFTILAAAEELQGDGPLLFQSGVEFPGDLLEPLLGRVEASRPRPISSAAIQPKTVWTPSLAKMIRRFFKPITAWGMASRMDASRASSLASLFRELICPVMSMELPRTARLP